jgi:hypothetical protein
MMKSQRTDLPEYRPFRLLKFELQIRSILQHAWAEIEHDLQYKTKEAIPRELQRRFARLSGLLELADDEFIGLRQNIIEYRHHVSEAIETTPNKVFLDRESLITFVTQSPLIKTLDRDIASLSNVPLSDEISSWWIDVWLRELQSLNFMTIQSVEVALSANAERIKQFAQLLTPRRKDTMAAFPPGISLGFYASWWIIYECRGDPKRMRSFSSLKLGQPLALDSSQDYVYESVYPEIYAIMYPPGQ